MRFSSEMLIQMVYIALFAPLIGAFFAALFGHKKKCLFAGLIPTILLFFSLLASCVLFLEIYSSNVVIHIDFLDWIEAGSFYSSFGFMIDTISVSMMVVVSLVSAMVHIYSIGYMKNDKGFNRYFSYLSAFVFSMMLLVMSDNLLGLFAGWEGVGLCSYLLIGFWYEKESANFASIEAFVINRIADLALIIGIFLIVYHCESLKYGEIFLALQNEQFDSSLLMWVGALLFIGAMGKSAQFPFHTWLADAMEGPTPVSALIHAATMVTAGVYLLVRTNPLYQMIPDVGFFIASLGAFVAIFGASMALVNKDLKRIIAYSTLSQLGYMFVAAGLGAYWIALFHLITHAFFKSLLFLGAGNVMHAMDDKLDITKMGGLHKPLRYTMILMSIASVALAGIYPFAGFFSKDLILEVAFSQHTFIWTILFITALFTAFYSFRLLMLVFFVPKNHAQHPHEAYLYMLLAMLPLAILSMIAGLSGVLSNFLSTHLPYELPELPAQTHLLLIGATLTLVCLIALFSIIKYAKGGFSSFWERTFIYKILINNYYIPKLYEIFFIKPYQKCAYFLWQKVELGIDYFADSIAYFLKALGGKLSLVQNGSLTRMLTLMIIGLGILLCVCVCYFTWRQL